MYMNLSKLQETVEDEEPDVLQSMGFQGVWYDLVTEQQLQQLFGNWWWAGLP